jgi:putative transposase
VRRRLKRFRQEGGTTALLHLPSGLKPGSTQLDAEVEFIIREAAKRLWALSENATVEDISAEITRECRERQFSSPSLATFGHRLKNLCLDPNNFSNEATRALQERRRLVRSSYGVAQPLAVVQIDHAVADILLVEPQSHSVIGRPALPMAVDVATRSLMGFCLSLEAPSSLLIALCLETAV